MEDNALIRARRLLDQQNQQQPRDFVNQGIVSKSPDNEIGRAQALGLSLPQIEQPAMVEKPGTWGVLQTTLAPVIDVLSRGQYASAKFFDGLLDESKGIFDNVIEATQEIYDPKFRMSFSDVIKKNAPVWSRDNPTSTSVLGFLGDVLLDPTTYIGIGFGKNGIKIGGKILSSQGEKLLGKEIAKETSLAISSGKKFLAEEVRKTAEQSISQLIEGATPATIKQLTESGKARLTFFGKNIPGTETVLNYTGLNNLRQSLSSLNETMKTWDRSASAAKMQGVENLSIKQKAGQAYGTIAGTLNRDFNLPDEWIQLRKNLENRYDGIADEVTRETLKLFEGFKPERRKAIGEAMSFIDDMTREMEQVAKGLGRSITQSEYQDVVTKGLTQLGINRNPDEMALVSKLFQSYKDAGEVEMQAGILKQMIENYNPRVYKELATAREIPFYQQGIRGISTTTSASHERKMLTLQEARALGFVPELDAAMLYANRMIDSRRKLAAQQFREGVSGTFGWDDFNKLPQRYRDDVRLIGESVYPQGMNADTSNWLKAFDFLQSKWKMAATTLKPSFAAKQLVSNSFQSALLSGVKAFKVFDPRSAIDAGMLLLDRGKPTKNLPDFMTNLISKYSGEAGVDAVLAQRAALSKITGEERLADYASNYLMKTTFGSQYTGTELLDLARSNGVIRGFDVTGRRFQQSVEEALAYDPNKISHVTGQLLKFWNHAAVAEDYSRMTMFLNGIRMGYSAPESASLVNKALFDYSRGLSSTEKNVLRRVIPFYTFQRFAIPYVLRQSSQFAGISLTTDKTLKLFDKLLNSGETLTEEDRTLFGRNFLVEQPRLFKGYDKDGKATFNVFNNLTPLDSMSFIKYDKFGNLDLQRTAEETILASITPFLKVPLELLENKNFFTGQTLDNAGKLGSANRIPAREAIGSVIPQMVKEGIGWENRVNPKTGEVTSYVNPYLAHSLGSFIPAARQFIRPLNADETALEAAMELVTGVGTRKFDPQQQKEITINQYEKQIREVKSRLRSAKYKGSMTEYENAQQDYQNIMVDIAKTRQALRNDR